MKKLTRKQLSEAMRQLGRKGGEARKLVLTKKRMKEIATIAANQRWAYLKETT